MYLCGCISDRPFLPGVTGSVVTDVRARQVSALCYDVAGSRVAAELSSLYGSLRVRGKVSSIERDILRSRRTHVSL